MHISIFTEAYDPSKNMSSDRRWGVENLFFRQKLEEKEKYFTALEVFVVFNSTKVNSREKKQNKQDLFFILHQKTSKSI